MVDSKRCKLPHKTMSLHWHQVRMSDYESSTQGSAVNTVKFLEVRKKTLGGGCNLSHSHLRDHVVWRM